MYINCAHLIEKAVSLRNWSAVSIELNYLCLDDADPSEDPKRSDVISTVVRMKFSDLELGRLPGQQLRYKIEYPTNMFAAHNNYMLSLENRRLEVEVAREDRYKDRFPPQILGAFDLTLNEIERKCPSDGSWVGISNRLESVGTINISAKRKSADIEYITAKKQEIEYLMKTQIETIERFNQDYSHALKTTLSSNVRGINGIPFLYAAIEIMAGKSLIKRILQMGADPRLRPQLASRCTPLELALRQFDRCRIKAQGARDSGRGSGFLQAQDQKCEEAKAVLDVLQHPFPPRMN